MKKRNRIVLIIMVVLSTLVTGCGRINDQLWTDLIERMRNAIVSQLSEQDQDMEEEVMTIELKDSEEIHFD